MADSVTTTYVEVVWSRADDLPGVHVPAVYVDAVWDRVEDIPAARVASTYIEVILGPDTVVPFRWTGVI